MNGPRGSSIVIWRQGVGQEKTTQEQIQKEEDCICKKATFSTAGKDKLLECREAKKEVMAGLRDRVQEAKYQASECNARNASRISDGSVMRRTFYLVPLILPCEN